MDHNEHKKAGALNRALRAVLGQLDDHDAVLVMDADTVLEGTFIERCLPELKPYVGGVGGRFRGKEEKRGLLPELQRMEFYRYGNEADRLGNRAFVLTGTGTLFSVLALREVKARRGYQLPAGEEVYDVFSLTEDNELTIAVNAIGFECIAPGPLTFTDVMPKVGMLWKQRKRWYLGALRNMWSYGRLMPGHLRWVYWKQQVGLLISSMGAMLYYVLAVTCLIMGYQLSFDWIWMIPTAVLAVERTVTVWPRGWKSRIMAVSVVGELFYTTLLLLCFLASFVTFASGSQGKWHNT